MIIFRMVSLLGVLALLFACQASTPREAQGPSRADGSAMDNGRAMDNSAVDSSPKPEELYALGYRFAKSGDTVRAEHYFNAALQAGYPEEKGFPDLITACIAGGRLRSALSYAEPRLRRHPTDLRLRYLVATLHLGLGQVDRAKHHLETVLSIDAKDVEAHYLMASIQDEQLHNETAAREHFEAYLAFASTGEHAEEVKLWLHQHPVAQAPVVATQSQTKWTEVGAP